MEGPMKNRFLFLLLLVFLLPLSIQAYAKAEEPRVTTGDVISVQPYSELTYYAVAVTRVAITYKDGTDLSALDAGDIHLSDRGYLYPVFGELPIKSIAVEGNTVTVSIDRDTTANMYNALVYNGAGGQGQRSKGDVFGVHACFSWYRETNGTIVESAHAFQFRETELKLWHTGENPSEALCQADPITGKYLEGSRILPTEIACLTGVTTNSFEREGTGHRYTCGGLMTLAELGIEIPSSSGIDGDYVKAIVSFPDDYDPDKEYPLILSLPGNNAAEWDIVDENGDIIAGNPYGAAFFNGSVFRWYTGGYNAIAIYVSHRYYSQFAGNVEEPSDLSLKGYNFVKDDMALIDHFIRYYGAKANHVILIGDSRGTSAASSIIKAYPGRISTFICCNGIWGNSGAWDRPYTKEDYLQAAKNGLSVWFFDGEADMVNTGTVTLARQAYADAGWSPEEIGDKLRISSIDTRYNYYWGETDHSATKFVFWYLLDNVYYGPGHIENGNIVYDSIERTEYPMRGKLMGSGRYETESFSYKVYPDTLAEWALSPEREIDTVRNKNFSF